MNECVHSFRQIDEYFVECENCCIQVSGEFYIQHLQKIEALEAENEKLKSVLATDLPMGIMVLNLEAENSRLKAEVEVEKKSLSNSLIILKTVQKNNEVLEARLAEAENVLTVIRSDCCKKCYADLRANEYFLQSPTNSEAQEKL